MPRRSFDPPAHLYPFTSHWLERDGTALHYLDEGAGTPVLMLHGNPTWSFLYRDVVRELLRVHDGSGPPACRCIVPDYPGFGLSGHPPGYGYTPREHAEWIADLVDHLELDSFVLLAQDWGGPIGLAVAVERAERVAGLVLANTWCWPPNRPMRIFSRVVGGPLGRFLHKRFNFFARRMVPWGIHRRERKRRDILAAYRAPFPTPASRAGTWVFPKAIRTAAPWIRRTQASLERLRDRPVELVWGMRDPAFGAEAVIAKWRRIFPGAAVDRLDDASHYLQEDRPDAVAAGVRRVLGRLANQAHRGAHQVEDFI